jgi:RNA polymerase sigma-70 factor (ECF subfamily)
MFGRRRAAVREGRTMSDDGEDSFMALVARAQAGDGDAAQALWRHLWAKFEPEIRREVEYRLRYSPLQARVDPEDVAQSALKSFFLRAAAGRYDLGGRQELYRLLTAMIRTKLAEHMRFNLQQRRDPRRHEPAEAAEAEAAPGPSPSEAVAGREWVEEFLGRLTEDERRLWDLHAQGLQWPEIAARVGGTAQQRNKQLKRAVQRVRREMGLSEDGDD